MDEEVKREIEEMEYEKMLWHQRFAPIGHPFFAYGEVGDFFAEVMRNKRNADPAGHVRTSKSIVREERS
jgi:hypothetical protein